MHPRHRSIAARFARLPGAPLATFAVLSTLLFITAGTLVGVRLLVRAARLRTVPEAALGVALFSFATVAQPSVIAAGLLSARAPDAALGLALLGNAAAVVSVTALFAFTWRVFRADARWAMVLAVLGSCVAVFAGAGTWRLLLGSGSEVAPAESGPWTALTSVSFAMAFGWAGIEALGYWVRARRRARIGLADPVVANRFALWGTGSTIALVLDVALGVLALSGADFARDALPRLLISVSGLANAIVWFLSFTPPAAYARWIAARAATEA